MSEKTQPGGLRGAMCTEQSKTPTLNIVRGDVSQTAKGFVFPLIRSNRSFVGFLREKQASTSRARSCSSKYVVKVEGVVTPPLGDAKLSLILWV